MDNVGVGDLRKEHSGEFIIDLMAGALLEGIVELSFIDIAAALEVDHAEGVVEVEV